MGHRYVTLEEAEANQVVPANGFSLSGPGLWEPPYRNSSSGYLRLGNPPGVPLKYRLVRRASMFVAFLTGMVVGIYGLILVLR